MPSECSCNMNATEFHLVIHPTHKTTRSPGSWLFTFDHWNLFGYSLVWVNSLKPSQCSVVHVNILSYVAIVDHDGKATLKRAALQWDMVRHQSQCHKTHLQSITATENIGTDWESLISEAAAAMRWGAALAKDESREINQGKRRFHPAHKTFVSCMDCWKICTGLLFFVFKMSYEMIGVGCESL